MKRYSALPLYIVTDGNKLVQASKIKALNLEPRVKKVYITHQYGIDRAKPSPWCFLQIAAKERVSSSEVVYIGDNPNKDFVGIKPLGFRTVRILRGNYADIKPDKDHSADRDIKGLDELDY